VFGRGSGILFAVLKRVTGIDLLKDLSEFFQSFGDMASGIGERAERVGELLGARESTFLLVTSPQRDAIDEAIFFHRRLRDQRLPFAGAIVNRFHEGGTGSDDADVSGDLDALLGEKLGQKVASNFADHRRLAEHDRRNVARLRRELGRERLIAVPLLDDDVHDVAGLAALDDYLFAGEYVGAQT
jgi:anion-transporting  ArsA/GET3 family ATPase